MKLRVIKKILSGVLNSLIVAGFLAASPFRVLAADRHFIYNYESGNLNAGEKDLETYTYYQFGRNSFYSALNQSVEFEVGLDSFVQTSVYLNFTQQLVAAQGGGTQQAGGPILDGISNEWKFKLADCVADPVGIGLYVEPEFEPDNFELETKLILDKRMESWLWTFNLLAAPQFDYADANSSFLLRPSLGAGYFFSDAVFFGFEAMDENFYDNQPMRSVFSMGPCLQYSGKDWWAEVTFMPQLINFGGNGLDFTDSQRDQIAVATSFSL
jgi:hypothetical protein